MSAFILLTLALVAVGLGGLILLVQGLRADRESDWIRERASLADLRARRDEAGRNTAPRAGVAGADAGEEASLTDADHLAAFAELGHVIPFSERIRR